MFYLKYRPQTVEEIDNKAVRERLTKLLSSQKVPHALLFTGSKGTGKTSCARIVAKVLNCSNNVYGGMGPGVDPCGTCEHCIAISRSSSVDVIEVDAASARKIDETKNLIAQVKFAPLSGRFKIYIIDEVHMLTKESFNALLKTLEEPPAATYFILATTELEKLPKTVISRCLQFNFAKAGHQDIVSMLKRIASSEKIKVDDDVLLFIARSSDNSFRDAAMLFEEATLQHNLTKEGIKSLLGLRDEDERILQALADGDATRALSLIDALEKQNASFKTFIEFALDRLRLGLLTKMGVATEEKVAYALSTKEISLLIKLFQEAYNALKYSPIESLPVEIAVVEYFSKKKQRDV